MLNSTSCKRIRYHMHTVVATLQEIIIPVFGGHKSDRPYQERGYEKSTSIDYVLISLKGSGGI